ncbi:hypothetical protein LPJCHP_LPJCHP_09485, partial [Dysosmobacter welbionis]
WSSSSCRSVCFRSAAAVPVTPGKAAALKPWARRTSITGSSAARWQRSSRYRCCLSALISSSSAGSASNSSRRAPTSVPAGQVPRRESTCSVPSASSGRSRSC